MDTSNVRIVVAQGREIRYCLERKNVKNLNLRIRKDGGVFVSANETVSCKEIDDFVCSKVHYIVEAIERFREMEQNRPQPKQYVSGETFCIQGRGLRLQVSQAKKDCISSDGIYIHLEVKDVNDFEKKKRLVNRFLDQQCKSVFSEVLEGMYPLIGKYDVDKPTLRIRDMETRWGSCLTKKGIITLNKRLIEVPRNYIEYVVMHELCHLIHPNHSKNFYMFLATLMPDWKERKQYLEKTAAWWL